MAVNFKTGQIVCPVLLKLPLNHILDCLVKLQRLFKLWHELRIDYPLACNSRIKALVLARNLSSFRIFPAINNRYFAKR
jgi:hypothetical protein